MTLEEDQHTIAAARASAYAKRAAREQQAKALDFALISQGGVVAAHAFVPAELVEKMRADALALEDAGEFACSGLSNSARGTAQAFGYADRIVRAIRPDLGGDRAARKEFGRYLDALCREAGTALGRSLICAEQYYSIHRGGAFLPRHMDEKHEELKGDRGWATSHRRSLSWLVYLSSDDVVGGAFRGYFRDLAEGSHGVGIHDGNIQVGWLARGDGVSTSRIGASEPVFLDAWVQASSPPTGLLVLSRSFAQATDGKEAVARDGGVLQVPDGVDVLSAGHPLSALYRVRQTGEREWLSAGFDARACLTSPPHPYRGGSPGSSTGALWKWLQGALAQQLPPALRDRFSSTEAVPHEGGAPMRVVDVNPVGGTLVMFDAVALPHEVLPTMAGERVAIAGWLHEEQPAFPDWFDFRAAPNRGTPGQTRPAVARHR